MKIFNFKSQIIKIFFIFLFLLTSFSYSYSDITNSQEFNNYITIEASKYKKTFIRVPDFSGPKGKEIAELLRKLLNYHLFLTVLKSPPLPGFKAKEFYVKGKVEIKNQKLIVFAEIWNLLENKPIKLIKIKGEPEYLDFIVYRLCDRIIQIISKYKGLAQTKIAYIKHRLNYEILCLMFFSKKQKFILDKGSIILFPKFSPSGKKIAYIKYSNSRKNYILTILDLKNRKKRNFFFTNTISSPPVWSPDEKGIFLSLSTASNKMAIYYIDLKTFEFKKIFENIGVVQVASVSPDGKLLAYVQNVGLSPQIYIYNLDTNKRIKISFEKGYNTSPRFLNSNHKILYISRKGSFSTLIIKDLKNNTTTKIDVGFPVEDPAVSPDGNYVLVWGKNKKEVGFYLIHLDSGLNFLYYIGENISSPTWASFPK